MVITYALEEIKVNVGVKIMDEEQYLYGRERLASNIFLPSLFIVLCNRVGIP